jgi:hypothetical protein
VAEQQQADGADGGEAAAPRRVGRHRAGLAITALLAVVVLVALPFAIRSMAVELFGKQQDALYDLETGQLVPPGVGAVEGGDGHYYNIAVVSIAESDGTATLAVSGNRECPAACPELTITMYSVDDNAAQRRGLPPSASVTLAPEDRVFSESVTLPVRGRPTLYPFDTYDLWLGFAVTAKLPNGEPLAIDPERLRRTFVLTLQNQDSGLVMLPPRRIDPATVRAVTDPGMLPLVEAIRFQRPDYIKVLSVLLVLLISVSGGIALATRSIDDLLLGVGGLILGVWGIRSVLVNQPLPGISAVDLALSLVILFLLLGLAIRLALHFHRSSELRLPRLPQRGPS